MGLLRIILGFSLVLGIHEIFHAIAATAIGVKTKRLSIGIGWGVKFKNVPWVGELVLSPIVIGAYVLLDDKELAEKSFFKKTFVSLAGMLGNVLLAIPLLVLCGAGWVKATTFSFNLWFRGWFMFAERLMAQPEIIKESVVGPIGIGKMLGQAPTPDMPYFWIVALISLNLALINLLPIPPLDGGRVLIDCVIGVFGKERGAKIARVMQAVGLVLILALFIYVISHDLTMLMR